MAGNTGISMSMESLHVSRGVTKFQTTGKDTSCRVHTSGRAVIHPSWILHGDKICPATGQQEWFCIKQYGESYSHLLLVDCFITTKWPDHYDRSQLPSWSRSLEYNEDAAKQSYAVRNQ